MAFGPILLSGLESRTIDDATEALARTILRRMKQFDADVKAGRDSEWDGTELAKAGRALLDLVDALTAVGENDVSEREEIEEFLVILEAA